MKDLWQRALELFRTHLLLWVPCLCAGFLNLALAWLEKDAVFGIARRLLTQHSVLGGDFVSPGQIEYIHLASRVSMVLEPIRWLLYACLFVIALVVTAKAVRAILDGESPQLVVALKEIFPEWREILGFSIKCFLALAAMGAVGLLSTASAMVSMRLLAFVSSKAVIYPIALALEGCAAWLLMPSAVRLLQMSDGVGVTTQMRKLGTASVVLTSAAPLVLGILIAKAEAGVRFENQSELLAVTVANSIVELSPTVFQFIVLALLAVGCARRADVQTIPEVELPTSETAAE